MRTAVIGRLSFKGRVRIGALVALALAMSAGMAGAAPAGEDMPAKPADTPYGAYLAGRLASTDSASSLPALSLTKRW